MWYMYIIMLCFVLSTFIPFNNTIKQDRENLQLHHIGIFMSTGVRKFV